MRGIHQSAVRPLLAQTGTTFMRHTKFTKTLRFEALETRRMLDGNVTANFTGGVLTLHGDSTSNAVEVFNTSADVVEVLGLSQASLPTTVGGAPSQLFQHVVSIVLDFNNGQTGVNQGDDAIVLTKLHLTGSASIGLGTGNDIVALGNFDNTGGLVDSAVDGTQGAVTIENGLAIDLQGGDNTVAAKDVTLDGPAGPNLTITGAGNDDISLNHVAVNHAIAVTETGSTTFNMTQGLCNSFRMSLGIGNDSVSIDHTTVGHTLSIKADVGDDSVSLDNIGADSLKLDLGAGTNQLTVTHAAITHDAIIKGGTGNDTVTLDTDTTRPLTIMLGDGDDSLSMTGVTSKTAEIHGGTGADTISATNDHATLFKVFAGDGADQVTLDSIVSSKGLSVDAGPGPDAVSLSNLTARSLLIQFGSGANTLSIDTATIAKKALIMGGSGNDAVTVDGLHAARLSALLGRGDDTISLENTTITGKAKLRGGPGSDTYTDASGNTFGKLVTKQIETTN
jgi:hypothetical protein